MSESTLILSVSIYFSAVTLLFLRDAAASRAEEKRDPQPASEHVWKEASAAMFLIYALFPTLAFLEPYFPPLEVGNPVDETRFFVALIIVAGVLMFSFTRMLQHVTRRWAILCPSMHPWLD
jgi:hypothetical protein